MYCFHYLPTHTYVISNSFTPWLVPTLLHTDELHLNTRHKYLINLCLLNLSIPSQILFKESLTPTPWYVHALLYHIYIGTLESPPFGLYVLISSLVQAIFVVSIFHILYPLPFPIFPRRLLVGYWPKPLSDLDLRTAYNINWMVLPGIYEENYLHRKPNFSLFICIQISSGKYHKWNISLFNNFRLTYPDGDITYSAITQGSHFPPTGNNLQCTNVIFPCQHTLSLIGVDVTRLTLFYPNPCIQAHTNIPGRPVLYIYRVKLLLHPHHHNYILCAARCPSCFEV